MTNYRPMFLDFFKDRESVGALDLIIDICYDIIYAEPNEKAAREKFIRVLYNLDNSNALHSLLNEDCQRIFHSFVNDFLDIDNSSGSYCIGNRRLAELDLYRIQDILIEIRYNQLSMGD